MFFANSFFFGLSNHKSERFDSNIDAITIGIGRSDDILQSKRNCEWTAVGLSKIAFGNWNKKQTSKENKKKFAKKNILWKVKWNVKSLVIHLRVVWFYSKFVCNQILVSNKCSYIYNAMHYSKLTCKIQVATNILLKNVSGFFHRSL